MLQEQDLAATGSATAEMRTPLEAEEIMRQQEMPITIMLQGIIIPETTITLRGITTTTTAHEALHHEATAQSAAHQEVQAALAAEEAAVAVVVPVAVAAEEEVNLQHISVPCLF